MYGQKSVLIAATAMAALFALFHTDTAFSQIDGNATDPSQDTMEIEATDSGTRPEALVLRLVFPIVIGAAIVAVILVWKQRFKKN